MAAVAWYYCAGNSVYYWTKAYDMSATQFAIAVSERIGRTITASDVAQAIRQKEVDVYHTAKLAFCRQSGINIDSRPEGRGARYLHLTRAPFHYDTNLQMHCSNVTQSS